jgi:ribosomal protein L24
MDWRHDVSTANQLCSFHYFIYIFRLCSCSLHDFWIICKKDPGCRADQNRKWLARIFALQGDYAKISNGREKSEKGDILYRYSSDHLNTSKGETQSIIAAQVKLKSRSFEEEYQKTASVQKEEFLDQLNKIKIVRLVVAEMTGQVESQTQRTQIAKNSAARYETLRKQDYVSPEQFEQKQNEWLDQTECNHAVSAAASVGSTAGNASSGRL